MIPTKLQHFDGNGKPLPENLQNNFANHPPISQEEFEKAILTPANTFAQAKNKQASAKSELNANNPFPVHVFPELIQDLIKEAKRTLLFPEDFLGSSILFAAGLAAGNTVCVKAKNSWTTSGVFYMALVGSAGVNKSHPLKFALAPLSKRDTENYHQYTNALAHYENMKGTELEIKDKPIQERILMSDYTPESLADLHKENRRGLGVYADELIGWIKNFDRYNKGNEQEFWLSAWSDGTITIDRKNSPPLRITKPFVSVIGTIQPNLLQQLTKDNRQSSGFTDRILFAFPQHLQKEDWCDDDLASVYYDVYTEIFAQLFSLQLELDITGNANPVQLSMCTKAKACYVDWYNKNSERCRQTEDESLKSLYCKFDVHILRFALVLELLDWACENRAKDFTDEVRKLACIRLEAMEGAIALGNYFLNCALMVRDKLHNVSPLDGLSKEKLSVYEDLPEEEFSTSKGLAIAAKHNMPERTFKRFLTEKQFFAKQKQGTYLKTF